MNSLKILPTIIFALLLVVHLKAVSFKVVFNTKDSLKPDHPNINFSEIFKADRSKSSATITKNQLAELKEGDILLRKGYGWISDRIADLLDEKYRITHCGIILTEGYKELHILHSISNENVDGVLIEPLKKYIRESQQGSLIAVRPNYNEETKTKIIETVKRMHDKKIPFDLAFNCNDSSKMYCAELFANVFKEVLNRDVLFEKKSVFGLEVIRMSNFLNLSEFKILFNQFENYNIKG